MMFTKFVGFGPPSPSSCRISCNLRYSLSTKLAILHPTFSADFPDRIRDSGNASGFCHDNFSYVVIIRAAVAVVAQSPRPNKMNA